MIQRQRGGRAQHSLGPRARSTSATRPLDIPREHRVFVNRNLRLDKIEMVGFDMDYTLALYNQARIEELSIGPRCDKLVTTKGYPEAIRALAYDPRWRCAGWWSIALNGNMFKMDRYGFPGRARHGLTPLERDQGRRALPRERTRLSSRRYAWIDTLFALPEAVLYAGLVDYFDRTAVARQARLRQAVGDIRECIDVAHRDGSIKAMVSARAVAVHRADPTRWPRRSTSSARRARSCSC